MTLGQRIQKGRKEAGLSQEELAEQLGVSRQAVSRWENDNGYPEMEKIIRLSQIYQVSLDYLVGNVDCQHFFRQIFLGYFSDIVQAFDTLRKNVCGDDYTSLHNPIVLSSVLPAYGMFHSIQILFL